MQHVKSRRVVVNPSGLWSLGLRFESGRDYLLIFNIPLVLLSSFLANLYI